MVDLKLFIDIQNVPTFQQNVKFTNHFVERIVMLLNVVRKHVEFAVSHSNKS